MKRILFIVFLQFAWLSASATPPSDTTATNGTTNTPNCAVTSSLPSGNYHTCITSQAPSLASITLTASGAGSNYTWSPAAGLSATAGASVVANPTVTTTYTLNGTGCTTPVQVTVTVFKPQGTLTASNLNPCQGTPVDFTLVGANVNQYSWNITPSTLNNGTDNPFGTGATLATTNTRTLQTAGGSNGINPGSYDIQVLASDVRYDNDPNSLSCYDFNATPLTITIRRPSVTIKNPTLPVCVGEVVTLVASPFPAGVYTYAWSPAAGLSSTSSASVTFTATTAMIGMNPPYSVQVTDAYGCKSIIGNSGLDAPIYATPTITVTPSTATICPGGAPVQLTASGGIASPFSPEDPYTWTPSTGLSATTGAVVNASPTTTTTYTVTGKDVRTGCKGTATAKVSVSQSNIVTITPNKTAVCVGEIVAFGVGITPSAGPYTYRWFISPNTLANGSVNPVDGSTNAALSFNTSNYSPGVYNLELEATSGLGCTFASNSVAITVNPSPDITLKIDKKSYCVGDVVTMTASGANSYLWSPATGLSATTGSSVTFTLGSTSPPAYQVVGTNTTTGCSATKTLSSLGAIYNSRPTITTSGSKTVCGGSSAGLSASGASSYIWSPATGLNTTTGANVIAVVNATTTYTVTGTDANGCKNTATAKVTIDPSLGPPNQSITYNCETKVLTIIPSEAISSYIYSVNGVRYPSNVIGPIFGVLPADNPISVLVEYKSISCYTLEKFTLPACALPVTWLNTTAVLNTDNTVSLNWETAAETQNKGFEIERSSNAKSFERIGFVAASEQASDIKSYSFIDKTPMSEVNYYRLKQIDNDGTFSYSRIVAAKVQAETALRVFPNPAGDYVMVESDEIIETIRLISPLGQQIKTNSPLSKSVKLSTDGLATGIYFLEIATGEYRYVKKMIKQ